VETLKNILRIYLAGVFLALMFLVFSNFEAIQEDEILGQLVAMSFGWPVMVIMLIIIVFSSIGN